MCCCLLGCRVWWGLVDVWGRVLSGVYIEWMLWLLLWYVWFCWGWVMGRFWILRLVCIEVEFLEWMIVFMFRCCECVILVCLLNSCYWMWKLWWGYLGKWWYWIMLWVVVFLCDWLLCIFVLVWLFCVLICVVCWKFIILVDGFCVLFVCVLVECFVEWFLRFEGILWFVLECVDWN